MKLGFTLLWFICLSSIGFGYEAKALDYRFKVCLKQALKKNTPPDRDNAKLICLEKFKTIPFSICSQEAMKMEYLVNSQEALQNCYFSRPQMWTTRRCLAVAEKLHTALERDSMRLNCVDQLEQQRRDWRTCKKISDAFEQTHHKERVRQTCESD